MKLYEGMFILDPQLREEELKTLIADVEGEIKKLKGEILESRNLGKKRLAYPINKQLDGYYLVLYFNIDSITLDTLNQKLRLKERLFRSLILSTTEELKKETGLYLETVGSTRTE